MTATPPSTIRFQMLGPGGDVAAAAGGLPARPWGRCLALAAPARRHVVVRARGHHRVESREVLDLALTGDHVSVPRNRLLGGHRGGLRWGPEEPEVSPAPRVRRADSQGS